MFFFCLFCFGFRPVLKDLSRILILLNRPEDRIGLPPADWETLLAWGERVLRRYKKQNPDQVSGAFHRMYKFFLQFYYSESTCFCNLFLLEVTFQNVVIVKWFVCLQVAKLLGFTQLPVEDSESPILDPSPYPTHLTTFSASSDCKLQSPRASANQLQQLAISAFDEAYNNQTR